MTMHHPPQWIVTTDTRIATLFACHRLPNGDMRLELLKSIRNRHEEEHERGRPSQLGGAERRGTSATSAAHPGQHTVAEGHTVEEEHRRFAREIRDWLDKSSHELGLQRHDGATRIHVFAPPRFLGLLREQVDASNADLREGELTHLREQELATHPSITSALAS